MEQSQRQKATSFGFIHEHDQKRQLGFSSLSNRFMKDMTYRQRMRDLGRNLDDMENLDDLARIPIEDKPMSYNERLKAGLITYQSIQQGAEPKSGGSDTVRGQKRWSERQWQAWNAWYYRNWDWRS